MNHKDSQKEESFLQGIWGIIKSSLWIVFWFCAGIGAAYVLLDLFKYGK